MDRRKLNRRTFLGTTAGGFASLLDPAPCGLLAAAAGAAPADVLDPASAGADAGVAALRALWDKPARTYKPHTRWWWPGNALSAEDITRQLEGMAGQGIGGVEIMSCLLYTSPSPRD